MALDYGKHYPKLLKLFTLWEHKNSARDYMYTNCYKVIAQDANDNVVPDETSLKTGVSEMVLENELHCLELQLSLQSTKVLSI